MAETTCAETVVAVLEKLERRHVQRRVHDGTRRPNLKPQSAAGVRFLPSSPTATSPGFSKRPDAGTDGAPSHFCLRRRYRFHSTPNNFHDTYQLLPSFFPSFYPSYVSEMNLIPIPKNSENVRQSIREPASDKSRISPVFVQLELAFEGMYGYV